MGPAIPQNSIKEEALKLLELIAADEFHDEFCNRYYPCDCAEELAKDFFARIN